MRRREIGLATGILLVAAALRIIGVADFPVWTDEGWTTWATRYLPEVLPRVAADRHPPLYFLAVAAWQEVAGMSRLALRLPSVYAGLLTAAVTWHLGRRLFNWQAAASAAALVAVLPVSVYYSQEIRHFGWLTLALCVSSVLFLRVLRRPTIPRYLVYAVSVAAVMYTLYFGVFVIAVQALVALFVWRGALRHKLYFVGAWALALGLYAPWLYVVIRYQLEFLLRGVAGAGSITETSPLVLFELLRDVMGYGVPVLMVAWVLAGVALARRWRGPARTQIVYVLAWGLGTFALMALINPWATVFRVRTVAPLIPPLALAAGYGIALLPGRWQAALMAVVLPLSMVRTEPVQPRLDYPAVARALAEDYQPGDLIVVETAWDDDAFLYEIQRAVGFDADTIRTLQWVDYRGENKLVVLEVEDRLRAAERIWVIHWNQPTQVASWLQGTDEDFEQVQVSYHGVGAEYEEYEGGYFAQIDGDIRLYLFAKETGETIE